MEGKREIEERGKCKSAESARQKNEQIATRAAKAAIKTTLVAKAKKVN